MKKLNVIRNTTVVILSAALLLCSCMSAKKRSECHARRGDRLFEKQKYEKAQKHLERAVALGDAGGETYLKLAKTYIFLGQYNSAVEPLEKAIEARPDDPEAWFMLGNAHYNMGGYDAAAAAYRKAIELKPDYLEAIEALAMLNPDGGVSDGEACELWKRTLTMESRDEWITRANYYIERLGCGGNE